MSDCRTMLTDALVASGLSAGELATRLGVTRAAVSHWVCGTRRPSRDMVVPLAEALGLDPATLALAVSS